MATSALSAARRMGIAYHQRVRLTRTGVRGQRQIDWPVNMVLRMRNPRDFLKPLAIGAPAPLAEIPVRPARMIHFLDFSNEKMVAKAADIATKTDVLLGNLEDAIPIDRKEAALEGLLRVGREIELGSTALWTRVNALESPWVLNELTRLVDEIGDRL